MPTTLDLVIERGRPEDAPAAARLIADTDVELFTLFGGGNLGPWLELSEHEWRADRGVYDYSTSQVARLDGKLVGLLISYSSKWHLPIDWTFGCSRAHMAPERFRPIEAVRQVAAFLFPPLPEDAYYVQNLATHPRVRGQGLGRRFMELAFAQGRSLGCKSCHLDVDSSAPAVQFYQHLGMRVLVKTEVPGLAIPPHFRMVIDL
jgi:ribosomal protein S18 acetylase RimI-like enzyme